MDAKASGQGSKPNLLSLPPAVLRLILISAEPERTVLHSNFLLCKDLLPYTLEALYNNCQILGAEHVAYFAAALIADPKKLALVRYFGVSARDYDPVLWGASNGSRGSGQIIDVGAGPYQPTKVVVGFGLIKELVRAMPHLDELTLFGKAFVANVLTVRFLTKEPMPTVRTIILWIKEDEDWTEPDDRTVLHKISLIPSLSRLYLNLNRNTQLPIDLLNFYPSSSLAPRSLSVDGVRMDNGGWLGPEIRNLFRAVPPTFCAITLEFLSVHPAFPSDLAVLPPSLRTLTLVFGPACPDGEFPFAEPTQLFPKVEDELLFLPNLEHLHLSGNIVTPATFHAISKLKKLYCLLLGEHTALDAEAFFPLLRRGDPSDLPNLDHLTCHICVCPIAWRPTNDPKWHLYRAGELPPAAWPKAFSAKDGEELLRLGEQRGILIEGKVRCVLGMCRADAGHRQHCITHGV
ncbi:hypothetical protein JCM10213v2_005568 [Rhodosporidiobolus nylandii]